MHRKKNCRSRHTPGVCDDDFSRQLRTHGNEKDEGTHPTKVQVADLAQRCASLRTALPHVSHD